MGFPGGSESTESACNARDPNSIIGSEDPLEKEMATHSSTLAWKIPWTEEPGRLQSMGLQTVRHHWATSYFLFLSLKKKESSYYLIKVVMLTQSRLHQFSSLTQSCPTLCNPMNCSMPGLPIHHQLPEFTQTHIHWVSDVIQLSHPLSSPSSPAPNPSQH